jgi:two-component system OmpR family response regulator
VVDDDPNIRAVICFALEKAGMSAVVARDGDEALRSFRQSPCDLIVLDIGMPETDGLDVCRQLRKSSEVPILFLSARDDEIDRVLGLEIGGDDYVTKPFSARELVARINVILRRARAVPAATPATGRRRHGALAVDPAAHRVTIATVEVTLTALEFAILSVLLARPGQVFNREHILDAVHGGTIQISDRTVDSHVRNIRAKLAAAGCTDAIETVHGVGFRLGPCGCRGANGTTR